MESPAVGKLFNLAWEGKGEREINNRQEDLSLAVADGPFNT